MLFYIAKKFPLKISTDPTGIITDTITTRKGPHRLCAVCLLRKYPVLASPLSRLLENAVNPCAVRNLANYPLSPSLSSTPPYPVAGSTSPAPLSNLASPHGTKEPRRDLIPSTRFCLPIHKPPPPPTQHRSLPVPIPLRALAETEANSDQLISLLRSFLPTAARARVRRANERAGG